MARPRLFILDVFAQTKYAGNQLAVVADAQSLSESEMQKIAAEMNFSETTFITGRGLEPESYTVRIFTPVVEVPFAGHPTLGTAYVIGRELSPACGDRVVLDLKIGKVPVVFESVTDGAEILWMRPPAPSFGPTRPAEPVAAMLGLSLDDIDPRAPVEQVATGIPFLIVPLRTMSALKRTRIDPSLRAELLKDQQPLFCVFLFCPQTHSPDNHLCARMFFEANGIREDPATGSANACLAAYLVKHGYYPGEQIDLRVEQGYEIGRPSMLRLRAASAPGGPVVSVGGRVVKIAQGELI